jgi:hypothetical protein
MKILAINASHRGDQGHTRFLIDNSFWELPLPEPRVK